jgi:hypothetical protein
MPQHAEKLPLPWHLGRQGNNKVWAQGAKVVTGLEAVSSLLLTSAKYIMSESL